MKIAVSGAHRTGKSTLVEDLRRSLEYEVVDEPYRLLEDDGYEFSESPSLEDFERMLERSLETIQESSADRIFDRCPADFLAYISTHRDAGLFDLDSWLPRVRAAMEQLDLVVLAPIEHPDRVALSADDRPRWRRAVDVELRGILLDDVWDFGVHVLEVRGDPRERLRQVLERLHGP